MRRYWVNNWIARRQTFGDYHNLKSELEAENPEDFQVYMRMELAMFRELLDAVEWAQNHQTDHQHANTPGAWCEARHNSKVFGHWI